MNEEQQSALREAIWWALKDDAEGVRCSLECAFTRAEVEELHKQLYYGKILDPVDKVINEVVDQIKKAYEEAKS